MHVAGFGGVESANPWGESGGWNATETPGGGGGRPGVGAPTPGDYQPLGTRGNTVQWKMGKIAASPCQTVSPLMVT